MSTDIRIHIEVKVNNKWLHLSHLFPPACYRLFSFMAGVRGGEPFIPLKDMPNDISEITSIAWHEYEEDGHHITWFTWQEIEVIEKWFSENIAKERGDSRFKCFEWWLGSWFFGGSFSMRYREDVPEEIQDLRMICWFLS